MGLGTTSLEELRELIGDCHRCALGLTRSTLVFGVGDPDARVMFIGEAPGRNEDLQGEPFVGAAGKFLDELLGEAGLRREQVYIANVLKCRPPGNRDPLPEEIETCTPFLREQIRLISPQVLVTLGNFATKFVLKTNTGITRLHGSPQQAGRFVVFPSFHPAAALYDRTKQDALGEDFRKLGELLRSLDSDESETAETPAEPLGLEEPASGPPPVGPSTAGPPTADQGKLF
jgi:DNA polymerase